MAPVASRGVVVLIKPPGLTSQSAVTFVKRILGVKKAGHGGTLDPDVAGVLPVFVGDATKIIPFLPTGAKVYRAEVTFGISTDTQDASGRPERIVRDFRLPVAAVTGALLSFHGVGTQIPPMTSALHFQGQRLYELARRGEVVDRPARPVEVHELKVLGVYPASPEARPEARPGARSGVVCAPDAVLGFGSRVLFEVKASRGFYVRTLCHDLGSKLGVGAHLSFLVRTASHPFDVSQGLTMEELRGLGPDAPLISLNEALREYPAVVLTEGEAWRVYHGNAIPKGGWVGGGVDGDAAECAASPYVRLIDAAGDLIAVARPERAKRPVPEGHLWLRPVRVFEEMR